MGETTKTIEPYKSLRRFSPEVSDHLARITAKLEHINAASVWPASAEALRFSAQVGTTHYSTLIEGNRLGLLEAERAARGELDARTKAEMELVNYVGALDLLDQRLDKDDLEFTEELFTSVHREASKGLGNPGGPFKPHHEGEWRDGEAGVWDEMAGALVHTGSPQPHVRPRMLGLIEWVNSVEDRPVAWPAPVVAGVVHYNIVEVHPFADVNGRTARLLTTAVLMRRGFVPGRLFNFDAHYGKDKDAYLAALRSVRAQTLNLETWMQYFLAGLAGEYARVAQEIDRLGRLGQTDKGETIQLSDGQQRALTGLAIQNRAEFTRQDYEQAASVKRSKANEDLASLSSAGVVIALRGGAARRYRFAAPGITAPDAESPAGRPRQWTDDRIEETLREVVGSAGVFPSVKRFDTAGRRDLYNAIQRHGGSKIWAERLGIAPPRRGNPRTQHNEDVFDGA